MGVLYSIAHGARIATAQQTEAGAILRGVVVRLGDAAPVEGAEVWLISGEQRAQTDSLGVFQFARVSPGKQLLQIRRIGYEVSRDSLTVRLGSDTAYRFVLKPQATQLDTVRTFAGQQNYVSPMLRGFEARRLSGGGGRFVSDSVLRRNENSTLTNIIAARIPGLMVGAGRALVSSRKPCKGLVLLHTSPNDRCASSGVPNCFVSVFVDGVLRFSSQMADEGVRPLDLSREAISNYGGIEFYADAGTAPAGMHSNDDGCGSLWLWTRER
jgi:hypothetical protein